METYKCKKGNGPFLIFLLIILINACVLLINHLVDLYVLLSLIKIFLVAINIYWFYYLILALSLKYVIDDDNLYIMGFWGLKKVKISFDSIKAYKTSKGIINGVKLSGIGKNNFAFGRYVLNKIGTTRMFVTYGSEVIYLKTEEINYAIAPEKIDEFKNVLFDRKIKFLDWEYENNKEISLHKESGFMLPFILVSVVIVIFTVTPFILYLKQVLPTKMPLSFNAKFEPVKMGTGKQFAFKQMTYGILNMAILFCMYYAAHFHAKYDKKSANRYIYIVLIIAVVFFLMQIKTLIQFI
ncbi:PH domain-containing protein [Clostridium aestuarii]|uniref:PH domain-containing protein n=1 Tax=Clostridium aestuarii TaxID=338193 RepID=A0ABT4CZ25_9CLOT|nr:PH domain-containing protein [Clostridium aestuarii]MCY6484236.1 PH domain-containing protein [Clostridium aestuarii]